MSRKWNGSKWIRREKRLSIYARDRFQCVYCEADLIDVVKTLDHVVPVELGGSNEATNLVTACKQCNSAKRDHTMRRFYVRLVKKGVRTDDVQRRVRNALRRKLRR